MLKLRSHISLFLLVAILPGVLTALSCDGDDPVRPTQPPVISSFIANPSDILPGDSSRVSYMVQGADSLRLTPGNLSLSDPVSGSVWVKPTLPTGYLLVAFNTGGVDSAALNITMSAAVPVITSFTASPDTLLGGDTATIRWATLRTDSIVVSGEPGKLANPDNGQIFVTPAANITYRAIAYNTIGRDTAEAPVVVQNPTGISDLSGGFYRGLMGRSELDPVPILRVFDAAGVTVTKAWLHFELVEGDGQLAADSLLPGIGGNVSPGYTFSGALGHAIVRTFVRDIDTVQLILRANTLIPGIVGVGQGQYIRLGETYADVKRFNGEPVSVDPDPRPAVQINYANYESQLGVVFMIADFNDNDIAEDGEGVAGVIVNSNIVPYPHKTADSIGIDSKMSDVVNVYGIPDTSYLDPEPVGVNIYDSLGLTFWTDPISNIVIEIHLVIPVSSPIMHQERPILKRHSSLATPDRTYRWRTLRYYAP